MNTENQERISQQAKTIALATTNRKPENVVLNAMLCLQAKQVNGNLSSFFKSSDNGVKISSRNLPLHSRTEIQLRLLQSKLHSWQAHLERISHYLIYGEGVWWEYRKGSFVYFLMEIVRRFSRCGPWTTSFSEFINRKHY